MITPAQAITSTNMTEQQRQLTMLRQEQLQLSQRHAQLDRMFKQTMARRDKLSKQLTTVNERERELAQEVFMLTKTVTKLRLAQSAFKKPGKITTAAQHLAHRRAKAANTIKMLVNSMSDSERQELIQSLHSAV